MKRINWMVLVFLLLPYGVFSQSVLGKWKTIDDQDGTTKAIVELYEKNGLLYGKIQRILEKGRQAALCIKCKGEKKDKPIKGMIIIDGFEKSKKGEYKGDSLLDPEQGAEFRGKIWLDEDNPDRLKVRGYLAFLYRTQIWHRIQS